MRSRPLDPNLQNQVADAILKLRDEGCPVAASDRQSAVEQARRGIRRLSTIDRRRRHASDPDERLNDLADGLIAAYEPDPRLVGPLKRDYLCLARCVLGVVEGPVRTDD